MSTIQEHNRLLESVKALDAAQTQQVLDYIQQLVNASNEAAYQKFKREAMKEIRNALSTKRKLKPAF